MSYETDNLKREIDSLKWQKAENYKLEILETTVRHLKEQIINLQNEKSCFEERLSKLEYNHQEA
jgi:hypothetical protein